ncbi:MAG: glycosyltransferase [bacterium]|nr:hypothetical protein [Deltaproteobacteria bacterium]MCP4908616.1 glycosyltransferase [bacterium]
MRLLLVGAFPYPHHQGSQVYFQEQAIALRAAGAEVELLTYASGTPPSRNDPDRWRVLDGFEHRKTPSWTAPASLDSGPGWGRPLADLGLLTTLRDAIASKMLQGAPYDAALTHNAEACLIGVLSGLARHEPRIPLVYCVHTLMENEISAYYKLLNSKDFTPSLGMHRKRFARFRTSLRRALDHGGGTLDRFLASRIDAWIALTHSSECVMRQFSDRPGELIPPPIPDPRHRSIPLDPVAVANTHGLDDRGFYLYSGNLDGYQELELLAGASHLRGLDPARPKIVLASHDPAVLASDLVRRAGMEARLVGSDAEMLSLLAAARASLVTRRAAGGFPIKLVNSLAVGTPPISFLGREWGLIDGENARLAGRDRPAAALAEAIESLDRSPELATRLGEGARALYEANHRPQPAAERTLALIRQIAAPR